MQREQGSSFDYTYKIPRLLSAACDIILSVFDTNVPRKLLLYLKITLNVNCSNVYTFYFFIRKEIKLPRVTVNTIKNCTFWVTLWIVTIVAQASHTNQKPVKSLKIVTMTTATTILVINIFLLIYCTVQYCRILLSRWHLKCEIWGFHSGDGYDLFFYD